MLTPITPFGRSKHRERERAERMTETEEEKAFKSGHYVLPETPMASACTSLGPTLQRNVNVVIKRAKVQTSNTSKNI